MSPKYEKMPLNLKWGEHQRNGKTHEEWYFHCDCALHLEPYPHIHPCCKEHDRNIELQTKLKDAEEQNKKLLACVGFYADKKRWLKPADDRAFSSTVIECDEGKLARACQKEVGDAEW